MMIELVVAVDNGWGIGNKGELLCRVRDDLKNFRALTTGKTVILGSKTLATFPSGKPLKNRRNIVLSRDASLDIEGAEVANSVEDALNMLGENENAVIIGGDSIYKQFLPYCSVAYVTKFDIDLPKDAFFPNLDADENWELYEESPEYVSEETDFPSNMKWKICTYKRK